MATNLRVYFIAYLSDPFSIQSDLLYMAINGGVYRVCRDESKELSVLKLDRRQDALDDIDARCRYAPFQSAVYELRTSPFTEKTLMEIGLFLVNHDLIDLGKEGRSHG